jgi:L-iditol 2-dehydrogenase
MKAAVLHAVGDLRIDDVQKPKLAAGEEACIVRIKYAGVCGSDIARVFRDGTYSMPLILGHEFAGIVEEAGPGSPMNPGQAVAVYPLLPCFECASCLEQQYPQCKNYNYFGSRCNGGFAEYVKVPYFNLVPVPDALHLELAALCEPASVAQHGLRVAKLGEGDNVLIFGAGPIGLIMAQWAYILGASEVTMVDISADKIEAGRAVCPKTEFINNADVDIKEALVGRTFSLCVEGTGAPMCYPLVIEYAENNGRVLLLGNPSRDVVIERATVSKILRKQISIQGTWNSTIAGAVNEWAFTLEKAASGELKLAELITHRYSLDELPEALAMMREGKEFFNKVVIEC